jgi:nucleotide-binding universal stress UspA family protein
MARAGQTPWARILAPLTGSAGDRHVLDAAAELARPFGAEVAAVYAPADIADLAPWMGEGFMGGVQVAAVESLKEASLEGEQAARAACEACEAGSHAAFTALSSPVWTALAMESRLSDVVVFDDEAARGRGPLAEAFQEIVAGEQRPTVVARPGLKADGVSVVAWDGGKEATRAARTALPLLQKASRVVVLSARDLTSRAFEPQRLADFYAARGVRAEVEILSGKGEAAQLILEATRGLGADLLVAGAYGHPRLREFIFGGTTRSLLAADGPSLFLSH